MFDMAGVVGMGGRKVFGKTTVSTCISANGQRKKDRDCIAGMARRQDDSVAWFRRKICILQEQR
jgi:hypothetical protein